jgi:hypothetical protein
MLKPTLNKTIQLQPSLPYGLESCTIPLHPIPKQLPPFPQTQHLWYASSDYHSSCSSCGTVTMHKECKHCSAHLRKLLKFSFRTTIPLRQLPPRHSCSIVNYMHWFINFMNSSGFILALLCAPIPYGTPYHVLKLNTGYWNLGSSQLHAWSTLQW